jgi:hypothetical protein
MIWHLTSGSPSSQEERVAVSRQEPRNLIPLNWSHATGRTATSAQREKLNLVISPPPPPHPAPDRSTAQHCAASPQA